MIKTKRHTLIVRGVTKAEKQSLKRIAGRSSVNQVILGLIAERTAPEIEIFKSQKDKKNKDEKK